MQKLKVNTKFQDFHDRTIESMKVYIDGMPVPFKGDWNCEGIILTQFEITFTTGEKLYIEVKSDGKSRVSFRNKIGE